MGSPSPSSGPKLKRSSSTSRAHGPPHRRSSSSISCVSLDSGDQDLLYSSPAKSITGKSNVIIPSSPRTPTTASPAGAAASPAAALKKRRSSIGGLDDLAKGLDFSISSSSPVHDEKKLHSFLTKGGGHKKVSPAMAQASGSPGKKTGGGPVPGTPKEKQLTVAAARAALSPSRKSSESSLKKDMPSSPQKLQPEAARSINGLTTPKKSPPVRASLDSKMLQGKLLSSPRLTPKSTKSAVRTIELAAADALLEGELLSTFSQGNKKTPERKPSPSPSLRSSKSSAGRKLTPSPPQLGRSRSRTDKGAAHVTRASELLTRPEMQSVTVYSEYEFDRDAVKKSSSDHMVQHGEEEEAEERSTLLLASLMQGSGNDDSITGVSSSLDHEPTSWLSEDNVCMFSSLSQLPEPDDSLVLGDPPVKPVLDEEPISSNGYYASNGVYDHVDHELNSFCEMLDDPADDGFEAAQLCTGRDATFESPQVEDTFEAELRTQIETTFDSPQLSVPQFVVPVVAVTKGETSMLSDVSSSAGRDMNQFTVAVEAFLQRCSSQDLQTGEAPSEEEAPMSSLESAEEILQLDQVAEKLIVKLEVGRRPIVEDEIPATTDEQVVESSDDESLEEIIEDSQLNLKQSFDDVAESQNRVVDESDHADRAVLNSPSLEGTSSDSPYTIGLQELALSTESEFAPQYMDGSRYNLDQDMEIFEEDWTQSTADDAGQNDAEDLLVLNTAEDAENSLPPVELPVSVLPVIGILKLTVEESDQPHATKLEIVEQTPSKDLGLDSTDHHAEVGATKLETVEGIPPEEDRVIYHAEVGATNVEIPLNDAPYYSPEHHAGVGETKLETVAKISPKDAAPDSAVSLERYHAELVGETVGETPLKDAAPASPVSFERYLAELVGETMGETPLKDAAPDSSVSLERYHAELVRETMAETPLKDAAPASPESLERSHAELVGETVGETPLKDAAPDSAVSLERYHAELVGETMVETPLKDAAPDSPVSLERSHAELVGETVVETPLKDAAPTSPESLERYHAELVGETMVETPLKDATPASPVTLERYHAATKLEVLGVTLPEDAPDSTVSSEYHQVMDAAYHEEDEESDEVFHLYGAGSDEVILFDVLRPEEPLNPILFEDVGESDSYVVDTTLDLHGKDVEEVEVSIKKIPLHDTSGNGDSFSATGDVEEPSSNAVSGVNIHNFDYDDYLQLEPELGTTVQDSSCENSGVSDRHISHVQSTELEPSPENPITLEAVDSYASCEGGGAAQDHCNLKDFSGPLITETDDISHALDLKILTDVEDGQTSPHSGATTKEVDSSESNAVGGINIVTEQASIMEEESFHGDARQERIENLIRGPEVQMTFDPEMEHQGVDNSEEGAERNSTVLGDNSFQDTSLTSRDIEVTVQHSSHEDEEFQEDQRISVESAAVGVNMSEVDLEPQMVQSPVIVTLQDFSASDDDTFEDDDIITDEFDAESEVISTASLDIDTEAPTDILGKGEVPFVFSAGEAPIIEYGRHDQIKCEDDHSIVGEQRHSKVIEPLLTVDDQCDPLHEESNGRANPCESPTQEADARGDFTTEDLVIDDTSSVIISTTPNERREQHDANPFLFGTSISGSVDHVSPTEDGPEVEKAAFSDKDLPEDGHAMKDAESISGDSTSQGLPSQDTLNGDMKGDIIPDFSWESDMEGESLEHNDLSPEDVMDNIGKSDQDTSSLDVNVDDGEEVYTRDDITSVYLNGRLQNEPVLLEDEEEAVFSAENSNGFADAQIMVISGLIGKDEENTTQKSLLEVEDTSDGASDIHADSEEDCFEEHIFLKDAQSFEDLDVAGMKEQSNPSACKDEDVLEGEENGVDNVVVQEGLEIRDLDLCDVQNHSWSRADNDEVESFNGSCVEEEVDEDTVVYRSLELLVESGQDLPDSTPLLVDEELSKVDPEEVHLNGEVVQKAERAMPGVEEAMVEAQEVVVENHEDLLLDAKFEALIVDEETREEEEDIVGKESTVEMVDHSPTFEDSRIAPDVLYANAEKGDVEKEIQHPLWRTDEEGETFVKESSSTVEVEEKDSLVNWDEDSTNAEISDFEEEIQHPTWKTDSDGGETLPEDRSMFEEKEVSSVQESDEEIGNAGTSDADEVESTSNGNLEEETVVQLKDQENGESGGHALVREVPESLRQSENTECHTKTDGGAMTSDKDADAVKVNVSGPKEALVISDEDDTNGDTSDAEQPESTSNGNLEEETGVQLKDQENGESGGHVLVREVPESLRQSENTDCHTKTEGGAMTSDRDADAVKVNVSGPKEALVISDEESDTNGDISDAEQPESTSNGNLEEETGVQLKDQENGESGGHVLVREVPESLRQSENTDCHTKTEGGAMTSDRDADAVKVNVSGPKEALVISDEESDTNGDISDAEQAESTSYGNLEEETVVQLKDQENGESGGHVLVREVPESLGQSENTDCHTKTDGSAMKSDKDADAVKVNVSGPKEALVISDEDDTNGDISDAEQAESTANGNSEEETVVQLKNHENMSSSGNVLVCQVPESLRQSENTECHSKTEGGALKSDKDTDAVKVEVSSPKDSLVISDEDYISDAEQAESTASGNSEEETVVQLKNQENMSSSGNVLVCQVPESRSQSENTECHSKTEGGALTSDEDTDAVKVEVISPKETLVISDEDDISDAEQAESTSNGNLEEETVVQLKDQENMSSSGNVLVCQVPDDVIGSLQSDSTDYVGDEELVRHSNGALTSDKEAVKVENYRADHVDDESETLALVKETWITSGLERTPRHEDMDSPDQELPQAAALYQALQPPFSGSKQDHLWEEQAEAYSSGGQGTPSSLKAAAPPEAQDDQIQPASGTTLPSIIESKGKELRLHTPLRSLLLEDAHMKAVEGTASTNSSPSFIRRLFRVKSTPSRAASERDLSQSKHKKSSSMWVNCLGSPQVKQ